MDLIRRQKLVCEQYGSHYCESPSFFKIGISFLNVKDRLYTISGLRHPSKDDVTGWYIWVGDYSSDSNFFLPVHVEHLNDLCPEILKFLGLAPGWRFLVAPNYEDVWEDITLLNV